MSMGLTPDSPTPHGVAYSIEKRRETMRSAIATIAKNGGLRLENAGLIASTYGVEATVVEAEMMKHLSEGSEK